MRVGNLIVSAARLVYTLIMEIYACSTKRQYFHHGIYLTKNNTIESGVPQPKFFCIFNLLMTRLMYILIMEIYTFLVER